MFGKGTMLNLTMCVGVSLIVLLVSSGCTSSIKTALSTGEPVELYGPAKHALIEVEKETKVNTIPELSETSSLDDLLAYAALKNPALEAAFELWKAALLKIPQVKALPDPRFNYAYFIRSVETRVGPQRHKFTVSQTFPWLSKLELRGDVAAQEANAQRARYEAIKEKLFYQVKKAYYEYYYLGRSIAITQDNLDLLKSLESVSRTQYTSGTALYGDVVRIQVELGKLEDRLRSLRDLRAPLLSKLNAVLNRPADAPLAWPEKIPDERMILSDNDVIALFVSTNPELKSLEFKTDKQKAAIELASKDYFPDLTVGVEMVETGEALDPSTPDNGKDAVVSSLSINLPIWFSKYRAEVNEARARYLAARRVKQDRENTLTADLKMALYGYRDAQRKIDLYKDSLIPKAHQSLEASLQDFSGGIGRFLDVIDAQRSLLEFDLALERARADRARYLAELDMLVGKPVPRKTP